VWRIKKNKKKTIGNRKEKDFRKRDRRKEGIKR
jgi:hypothetical protein